VTNNRRLLRFKVIDEANYVGNQLVYLIVLNSRRLVTEVVAAHVGRDDVEALAQRVQLLLPGIPKLRKTMQQDHELVTAAGLA